LDQVVLTLYLVQSPQQAVAVAATKITVLGVLADLAAEITGLAQQGKATTAVVVA
jgi:hypothetical protein